LSLKSVGHPLSFAAVSELSKGEGWEEEAAAALLRGIEEKEKFALTLI